MTTDFRWIISSTLSALILLFKEKNDIKYYNFYDCMTLIFEICIAYVVGPFGLALLITAALLYFIATIIKRLTEGKN